MCVQSHNTIHSTKMSQERRLILLPPQNLIPLNLTNPNQLYMNLYLEQHFRIWQASWHLRQQQHEQILEQKRRRREEEELRLQKRQEEIEWLVKRYGLLNNATREEAAAQYLQPVSPMVTISHGFPLAKMEPEDEAKRETFLKPCCAATSRRPQAFSSKLTLRDIIAMTSNDNSSRSNICRNMVDLGPVDNNVSSTSASPILSSSPSSLLSCSSWTPVGCGDFPPQIQIPEIQHVFSLADGETADCKIDDDDEDDDVVLWEDSDQTSAAATARTATVCREGRRKRKKVFRSYNPPRLLLPKLTNVMTNVGREQSHQTDYFNNEPVSPPRISANKFIRIVTEDEDSSSNNVNDNGHSDFFDRTVVSNRLLPPSYSQAIQQLICRSQIVAEKSQSTDSSSNGISNEYVHWKRKRSSPHNDVQILESSNVKRSLTVVESEEEECKVLSVRKPLGPVGEAVKVVAMEGISRWKERKRRMTTM